MHESHGSNVVAELDGLPAAALEDVFASAAHVVSETIYQQAYARADGRARPGRRLVDATGELTIYAATQSPHEVRLFCSRLLGMPEHRIRVIMRDTGGGFGQKIMVQRDEMCLMLAAPKVGAPVKWVEDRRENLLAAGKSRHEHADVTMAFDADGAIQAAHIDFVSDCGAYPTPWPVGPAAAVGMLFPGPYRVPRAGFATKTIYTNTVGPHRVPRPVAVRVARREMLLDIAARRMGIDPVELRRRNLLRRDELPYANPNGMTYDSISPIETFEQALAMLDYDAFRAEQAGRAAGRYLGVGLSNYVEPSTPGYGSYATEAATIRIEPSGAVNVYIAGGSTGNSLETTVVQLTGRRARREHRRRQHDPGRHRGHRVRRGRGRQPQRIDDGGRGARHGGDPARPHRGHRRAPVRGGRRRHRDRRQPGVRPGHAVDRHLTRGAGRARLLRAVVVAARRARPASRRARGTPPPPRSIWVNATHVCTCEVDVTTGRVTLLRYIVSEDCGPMINPNVVEGQIAGGVAQGIGGALYEHLAYDDDGNPVTTTFMDYLLPTACEVPVIEYGHIETPSPGPGGYKGVGEGGAIGAPPCVVNAVADALSPFGVTVTRLP